MNHVLIKRIEMVQVAMSLRRPHVAAHGVIDERPVILARIWDADGAYGWGECVAFPKPGYVSETVDSAWDALHGGIIPSVHNRRFDSPDHLAGYLAKAAPRSPIACATVEMAAWDMVARRQERSLANLLGGTRHNIATGRTFGLGLEVEALVAGIEEACRAGYQRIKIKVDPAIAMTTASEALRAAAGTPVLADANGSFSPGDVPLLRQLDSLGLEWIEQPYAPGSLRQVADLQDLLATPIALDESADRVEAVRRIVDMHAARALSIKPGRLGGHAAARTVYKMTRASGFSLWIGGMLETGIGRAHNLALASLAGFDLPGDMGPSDAYWKRDIISEPIEMVAGHIGVPAGPGIGVEIDSDYMLAASQRRHVVR